jgi:hypothetical protein
LCVTLEHPDGGGEVVDTAGGLEGGGEDLDGGDEIVGEAVVQIALGWMLVWDHWAREWMLVEDSRQISKDRKCRSIHPGIDFFAYLELENVLDTIEFLLESAIDKHRSAHWFSVTAHKR